MPPSNDLVLAVLAKHLADLRKAFTALARQPGPSGERGERGERGDRGETGPRGDRGEAGERGDRGPQGAEGQRGQRGPRGEKGERGDVGPKPKHEWSGTRLRFERPDGSWGDFVDLEGPKGPKGERGAPGGGVFGGLFRPGGGFDPGSLPAASDVVPVEVIVKQGEGWARATFAQLQQWLGSSDTDLDGGSATSVFKPSEVTDGGGANG